MTEAFIRKYSLTIGRNSELISVLTPEYSSDTYEEKTLKSYTDFNYIVNNIANQTYYFFSPSVSTVNTDIITIPPKSITINDLQIEVQVKYNKNTTTSSSDVTVFTIYNMSPRNRDFIKIGNTVIFKAGYADGKELPMVFLGQVTKVDYKHTDQDSVTMITCKKAEILNQLKIAKSWPPNITVGEILDDITAIMASKGCPTGLITSDPIIRSTRLFFGYIMMGDLLEKVNTFCQDYNLRAYISQGKFYIDHRTKPKYVKTIKIYPKNVIGSIVPDEDGSNKPLTREASDKTGIKVTVFLNGNLNPNTYVNITYGKYTGYYEILSMTHKLNLEGGEWITEISCKPIKENI